MADFPTCYPFLLGNEDFTPPQYKIVPDPVRLDPAKHTPEECQKALEAQAISGINSYYWPEDFAAIAALPQAERGPAVASFYERRYWNNWFTQVVSNREAAMILDSSVNQGSGVAVRLAQVAAGMPTDQQDGKFGPVTLAAINGTPVDAWVPAFMTAREARYQEVGGPSLPAWLKRAAKIPEFA